MASKPKTKLKQPQKGTGKTRSSFKLWRKTIPDLAEATDLVRQLFKAPPKTDEAMYEAQRKLGLVDVRIKLSKAINDTLVTELKARREAIELRKLEMDSMTDDHLEELFTQVAKRRGLKDVQEIRVQAVAKLIDRGMSQPDALALIDSVMPMQNLGVETKPMSWQLRTQLDHLMVDLDEGAESLRSALQGQIDDDSVSESQEGAAISQAVDIAAVNVRSHGTDRIDGVETSGDSSGTSSSSIDSSGT